MLGLAIVAAVIGFVLKLGAAAGTGWFLVPLAAVACVAHVVVHAKAARPGEPLGRLALLSDLCRIGALLGQLEYTPGYNCAEDTLSSILWRLGMASEEGCILLAGPPAIIVDLVVYIPVAFTWVLLLRGPAEPAR